mmetsp:Transcript_22594/g.55062  ORF Transcript_22594/g.55062 Transcript_22594/m.55062 type:complete len:397 (-) Transcript_22594:2665-3855(-)
MAPEPVLEHDPALRLQLVHLPQPGEVLHGPAYLLRLLQVGPGPRQVGGAHRDLSAEDERVRQADRVGELAEEGDRLVDAAVRLHQVPLHGAEAAEQQPRDGLPHGALQVLVRRQAVGCQLLGHPVLALGRLRLGQRPQHVGLAQTRAAVPKCYDLLFYPLLKHKGPLQVFSRADVGAHLELDLARQAEGLPEGRRALHLEEGVLPAALDGAHAQLKLVQPRKEPPRVDGRKERLGEAEERHHDHAAEERELADRVEGVWVVAKHVGGAHAVVVGYHPDGVLPPLEHLQGLARLGLLQHLVDLCHLLVDRGEVRPKHRPGRVGHRDRRHVDHESYRAVEDVEPDTLPGCLPVTLNRVAPAVGHVHDPVPVAQRRQHKVALVHHDVNLLPVQPSRHHP